MLPLCCAREVGCAHSTYVLLEQIFSGKAQTYKRLSSVFYWLFDRETVIILLYFSCETSHPYLRCAFDAGKKEGAQGDKLDGHESGRYASIYYIGGRNHVEGALRSSSRLTTC